MTPEQTALQFLFRAGTLFMLVAWVLGSAWYLIAVGRDIYARWGSWQTSPIPDKRAIKHLVAFLALIGINLLLTWFGIWWFAR